MAVEQVQIDMRTGNQVVQPTDHLMPDNFTESQRDEAVKRSCNTLNKTAFNYNFVYYWKEKI